MYLRFVRLVSPPIRTLFLVLSLVVVLSLPAMSQTASTGTVSGVVTDPSGAVIPGAVVTLTDLSTHDKRTTTTNDTGRYVIINVTPGRYDLTITKSGFTQTKVSDQTVQVGTVTTENVAMKLGQANEVVEVKTTGTELQTMNSTIGNTMNSIALDNLPSLGRDTSTFVAMQPGISPDGSVAGTVVDQSTFMLDGGNNTNDMDGSMNVYTPSFAGDPTGIAGGGAATGVMPTPSDSVEEFKVNTTNQTADFNNSSGAQVQVVTKRGRDKWHGTGYEYYFDNNWNANTWNNNKTHTPAPDYHYSRFGFSAGGPILPNMLGGKTYFFANYQGFRWPNSETIEHIVPSANLKNGIITTPTGTFPLASLDPRGIGISPVVKAMWATMPAGNDPSCGALLGSRCDGLNEVGFKANMAIPQNDNFVVGRLDHDFGSKWHFMASYRFYKLTRTTDSQYDISSGTPVATSGRPQEPWYYVVGLTTNITTNTTNDFHWSYLRNWWQWSDNGGLPQVAGTAGALEPFGENKNSSLTPYNVDTQDIRTRFWDGQDHMLRDDVTMLKGNHLFQFGGTYQHNFNYHQRTDNGGGINDSLTYQLGSTTGGGAVTGYPVAPAGWNQGTSGWNRLFAASTGIVTAAQQAYTRSGTALSLNPPLTPASDQSTIPYYNVYFSDSWHMKPTFTLTYGLGWTLEMPPTEAEGKQIEFVDQAGQPIDTMAYLNQREQAALKGQVYNPTVGYALVGNTAGGLKYPYNPFYGSFSPRIAAAWSPHFGDNWMGSIFGRDNTVIRGGYGRIYGRLNGVDLVLVPLLGTGLIQPVQCTKALATGQCGPATATATTAFRIGVDGTTAPLPAASASLPQPLFPGINDVSAAAGEALDPHFRPNVVDSFDLTIQRQLTSKMTVEVGYIGRLISHEYQPINVNAVPYMMTLGGQSFAQAYAAIETAMGCATSAAKCNAATVGGTTVAPQPFFETALAGTGYCAPGTCTQAVLANEFANFQCQCVWDLWSDLDQGGIGGANGGGTNPGFNFARTMMNSQLPSNFPLGASGQISSGVGINASVGHGNYHAGFISLKINDWHGVTSQTNFTYSKALGTGAEVQATSEYTPNDPYNLDNTYGVQPFNRKYVFNQFFVVRPHYRENQAGIAGRLLGGWTFAPIITAGSGAPLYCNTITDSEAFGSGDATNFFDNEQCVTTSKFGNSVNGSGTNVNFFSDPNAAFNTFRAPILGIDTKNPGVGPIVGLPYWNVDLSVKKSFKIWESTSLELSTVFTNLFNHMQFTDPDLELSTPASWGALTTQRNNPRQMEFGIRINW